MRSVCFASTAIARLRLFDACAARVWLYGFISFDMSVS